jgi:hypothetical protein
MTRKHIPLMLVLLTVVGLSEGWSQYKSERDATIPLEHFYIKRHKAGPLRFLLSKLHFSLSTGYSATNFNHHLDGLGVSQTSGLPPQIFTGDTAAIYSNWVTDLAPGTSVPAGSFLVRSDTAELGFRSKTFTIPLKASVHIEFSRYRIGGGYEIGYTRVGTFKPISFGNDISGFTIGDPSFFMKHYFGMVGAMVYRYYEYTLVADANIGGFKLGKQFNPGVIQKSLYFNVGATVEREFSEYFRVFVRPSYEIKGYKITIPEGGQQVSHRLNTININVGVTYRLPEIRRCFLKSCHAQITHAHGNKEYRSRMHPIYKKQNPHYGENYPELIKYKGKNKKKLSPY